MPGSKTPLQAKKGAKDAQGPLLTATERHSPRKPALSLQNPRESTCTLAAQKLPNVPRRAHQGTSQRPSNNNNTREQRLDHPHHPRPHPERREAEPSAPRLTSKHKHNLNHTTNQELPEALYGRNLLALRHDASGVRLAFDAREALRSWALLDAEPIPHRSLAASFRSTA